jgi:hypothetical protein
MKINRLFSAELTFRLFKIIFIVCAIYFFLMGSGLIIFPRLLIKEFSDGEPNPVIIGMLRGAGGSILPYSLLYIWIYKDPFVRFRAVFIVLFANITAISLDIVSLILGEYKLSYSMIDIPIEVLSLIGIWILWLEKCQIVEKE